MLGEGRRLTNLEEQIAAWRADALKRLPPHTQALGRILRTSVRTHRLNAFARWCRRRGFAISRPALAMFRDFLITQHVGLKDLEPEARARLRAPWLAGEREQHQTADYAEGIAAGADLRCRDCAWFVHAPRDGDAADPHTDQSCVELGTKGADRACYGFTRPSISRMTE